MRRSSIAAFGTALIICGASAFGQIPPDCRGPAQIERALTVQPSAGAYNALGAWFAQKTQEACAIAAFPKCHSLEARTQWRATLNLALADQHRDFQQAVRELETAAKFDPSRAQVHLALGIVLEESGQLAAAETGLRSVATA